MKWAAYTIAMPFVFFLLAFCWAAASGVTIFFGAFFAHCFDYADAYLERVTGKQRSLL